MSDELLLNLCKKFGKEALCWKWKFIGLLPEVNRRKLYESSDRRKKSYSSIVEFASKLAGISREQVYDVLSLDRTFEDKPVLRKMFVNGEVSVNKLIRIASVVTVENQEFWATQVKHLSKSAIETLVRDEKILKAKAAENGELFAGVEGVKSDVRTENTVVGTDDSIADTCTRDGLFQPGNSFESVPGHRVVQSKKQLLGEQSGRQGAQLAVQPLEQIGNRKLDIVCEQKIYAHPLKLLKLQLGEQLVDKLLEMQIKGLNINQILTAALQKRDDEIAAEKEKLHEIAVQEAKNFAAESNKAATAAGAAVLMGATINQIADKNAAIQNPLQKKPSHYVNVTIRNLLSQENGTKCAIPTCKKLSKPIHHSQRFALAQVHDPYFMAQLCEDHHQIAHAIDLNVQKKRSGS